MIMKSPIILLIVLLLSGAAVAKYSGGSGTAQDPYLIATPNDLNSIGLYAADWDKHFKMTADINMAGITGEQFNIIGSTSPYFRGVFDGNGHSISNFTYNSISAYKAGIFGWVSIDSAEIKNLVLICPNVDAGDGENAGSLVGYLYDGKIHSCTVVDCSVSGRNFIGGLVGTNRQGEIYSSSASGNVNGLYDGIGGLAGHNRGLIQSCWSSGGSIKANGSWNKYVGGLVGYNSGGGQILASFSGNQVSGHSSIGGLVGGNGACTIQNCYSFSNVDANEYVGGLVGGNWGTIVNCYAAAAIDGESEVGAFCGHNASSAVYIACYWDLDIVPDFNGLGSGNDPNVIGLPTSELQKRATFADAGWSMVNVWDIGENQTYPFLRTHLPSDINKDDETNLYDLVILAENWLE